MPELPTGTVTFLFSDIEGSTRLLQRLGPDYARVLGEHQALLRAAFAAHDGMEVDTQGDAFFVAFATAPAALAAAADATRALAGHAWPGGTSLRVRIGLHTGTPQLVGDHYVGLDVHRAARIAAAGHGGQVLLSDTTRALAEQALPEGATLRDLGAHRLKDLQHAERLYQLTLPGLPADFPPLKTLDTHQHNLPLQPTALLGREEQIGALCALLRHVDVRLVTLTGPGGIGKTRLAVQVAAELVEDFADGVWFVGLARLSDPDLLLPTIAQTLGLQEQGSQPLAETLRAYLREKRLLVVLDNFEQIVGAADVVAGLLADCSGLRVLVTSRQSLRLRGEKVYPLAPLSLPEHGRLPPAEQLIQYPAVALFIARARDAQPTFALTMANAQAIADICARVDGLPLAIELAAAQVRILPPAALLARLSTQLTLRTGGPRDVETRQQTMRSTLAWSENLLSEEERVLFRRLSVFVGGGVLEAVEAVSAAPHGTTPLALDVLEGLGALVDQSLVWQREETDGTVVRFGMLRVIREYALEQLEASGEAEAMRQAHAEYYVALAEQAEPELTGPEQLTWLGRLEGEHDNLRAALRWARDSSEPDIGLRLAGALSEFWWRHGHLSEGRSWLEGVLAVPPPDTAPSRAPGGEIGNSTCANCEAGLEAMRAKALYGAANLATWQGDYGHAVPLAEQSLILARLADAQVVTARALTRLGLLAFYNGEPERAVAQLEESLALARRVGDPVLFQGPLVNLGYIALYQRDFAQAAARFEEALARARQAGDWFGQTNDLITLGNLARRQGNLPRATTLLREGLGLAHQLKDPRLVAETLEYLAMTTAAGDEMVRAGALFGAAAAIRETNGIPQPPPERADTEAAAAAARAALGEEAWAAAVAAGRAMTSEAAIAAALEGRHVSN